MAVEVESGPPLFERDSLEASLDLILGGDARAADELARLLNWFCWTLDEGLRGINEARAALAEAVEILYLRTGAHASALMLYRLSLEGQVLPGDEPDALLDAAIARSAGSVQASRSSRRASSKS